MIRNSLAILLATFWISISEFLRNQFLLRPYWVEHYQKMGQVFPEAPINGAIWGLWALVFACLIFVISRRFKLFQSSMIAWGFGFLMMWIVIGNLGVLPYSILSFAVPLSLLESFMACFIIHSLAPPKPKSSRLSA